MNGNELAKRMQRCVDLLTKKKRTAGELMELGTLKAWIRWRLYRDLLEPSGKRHATNRDKNTGV